ncbi:hypothetical protein [Halalkalibacter oceani]|uniref:Uncharacterized protein n=1 Tax=Halalkalibacter oceani TaxID=1653776 RepID=A0A9X2DPF0_9BACI|nr:hypothetical protein [Halalkalibacter oceani]MCM3713670.1 hypothetical protein [Halalkalibacter oceani]
MRYELVHFLQHTNDEQLMLAFMKNMDGKSLSTLFHYLSLTDDITKKRWLTIYENLIP